VNEVEAAVARVARQEWGRVTAALVRDVGDLELAEDAVQDALVAALAAWAHAGVPARPAAWVTTAARRKAIDRLRRDATLATKTAALAGLLGRASAAPEADEDDSVIADDQLRLIFACCHPSLSTETQVALTLRTLCGLTTTEISRAFLVPEATLAQRLARAKRKMRVAGIPFRVPPDHLLGERLAAVLAVVYLVYNEGYSASGGDQLVREELCAEAVRLARLLATLMPDEPEVLGLLALLLLTDARRPARVGPSGQLVLLEEQDRRRWDRGALAEGRVVAERAARLAGAADGPYQLQAVIAAEHARATDPSHTDWTCIAALYDRLAAVTGSAVVELNRAVAVAMADGPAAGLALVEELAATGALRRYLWLHTTRADLLRRLGRCDEAASAYAGALALAGNDSQRQFIRRRMREVGRAVT
jgi:RNA polymerase sigma-70 factor (ECF subfamily)